MRRGRTSVTVAMLLPSMLMEPPLTLYSRSSSLSSVDCTADSLLSAQLVASRILS